MMNTTTPPAYAFSKAIAINATAAQVWAALTDIRLMKQWMSETEINVITDWQVGNPMIIRGDWYKTGFENKGKVLQFIPERELQYSHLSSLSRLPDVKENYSVIGFKLEPREAQTELTVMLHNFPTETIYRHLAFYWNVTLEVLRKFIEGL